MPVPATQQLMPWMPVMLAAATLWRPAWRGITLALLAVGYVLAGWQGRLAPDALAAIAVLVAAGIAVAPSRERRWQAAGHAVFVLLALALCLHWLPGFDNLRAIDGQRLSAGAMPFTMYLNLDKPLLGFWVVLACPWALAAAAAAPGWRAGPGAVPMAVAVAVAVAVAAAAGTAVVCLGLAFALGLVSWAPKWPAAFAPLWALNNLLLVSLAEEALFRGYLQGGLSRLLARGPIGSVRIRPSHAEATALLIAALLFGLAHAAGGWPWIAAGTLAGIGYGLAWRHGGLAAAVLAHFGVNLAHFALFTYPMLA
ncbi:CPBP family glutamic-type intramembrane protease [Paracidovorax citrulli]